MQMYRKRKFVKVDAFHFCSSYYSEWFVRTKCFLNGPAYIFKMCRFGYEFYCAKFPAFCFIFHLLRSGIDNNGYNR